MKFLDELRNLDMNDIGRWPLAVRVLFVALFFSAASAAGSIGEAWGGLVGFGAGAGAGIDARCAFARVCGSMNTKSPRS